MNLKGCGKIIAEYRKKKGFTQKQIAQMLCVVPKTVSKWETGNGMPSIELVPKLAEILGVSAETILQGEFEQNKKDAGNINRMKICVCPNCGAITESIGNGKVICCGKQLEPLRAKEPDEAHKINVSQIENDFYITFSHDMTKEHYLSFIIYKTYNKVMFVKLYPEQEPEVRFPVMHGGKFMYYCNKHGLFVVNKK